MRSTDVNIGRQRREAITVGGFLLLVTVVGNFFLMVVRLPLPGLSSVTLANTMVIITISYIFIKSSLDDDLRVRFLNSFVDLAPIIALCAFAALSTLSAILLHRGGDTDVHSRFAQWGYNYNIGILLRFYAAVLGAFIGYILIRDRKTLEKIAIVLVIGGLASVALGYIQILFGAPYFGAEELQTQFHSYDQYVVKGFFPRENSFGMSMIFLIPFLVAYGLRSRLGIYRLLFLAALVPTFIIMLMAGSRSGILAVLLAVIALSFLLGRARKRTTVYILAITVILIYVAIKGFETLSMRPEFIITSMDAPSLVVRLDMIKVGFLMMFDYPLTGVGAGGYPLFFKNYVSNNFMSALYALLSSADEGWAWPHNAFARMAADHGVPGLLIFSLITVKGYRDFILGIRGARGVDEKFIIAVFFAIFIGYTIGFLTKDYLQNFAFWILLGIGAGCRHWHSAKMRLRD